MSSPLHLFAGFGIELEYMVVSEPGLDVLPVVDRVLAGVAGEIVADVVSPVGDRTAWSNELALHVLELKTNGPAADLAGVAEAFQADIGRIHELLAPMSGRLMPGGMHPWMDPYRELRLWPHEASPVYEAFDRVFDCRGHGWANLQSVHLNLPFADDEEFARLHAAIRLVLPILPALAASSPVRDGRPTGLCDTRLLVYQDNCRRVPSLTGQVIPEPVFSRVDYEEGLLAGLYRDIAPFDPDGILQDEWLNARGAIARFDRMAIEIRVLDVQECPLADVAICAAIAAVLQALVAGRWGDLASQKAWPVAPLFELLGRCIAEGDRARVEDPAYLAVFGLDPAPLTAAALWRHVLDSCAPRDAWWRPVLDTVLEHGCLARRLLAALGPDPDRARIARVYRELCDSLQQGRLFVPAAG